MGSTYPSSWLLPLALLVAQTVAQATTTQPSSPRNTGYNGGDDNPQDPSDAGAAGTSKGAFNLSKGGLAAIIVVAVLVGVLGSKHPSSTFISVWMFANMHPSWLSSPFLACEKTPVGRPSVSPPCFPPPHRSLDRGSSF